MASLVDASWRIFERRTQLPAAGAPAHSSRMLSDPAEEKQKTEPEGSQEQIPDNQPPPPPPQQMFKQFHMDEAGSPDDQKKQGPQMSTGSGSIMDQGSQAEAGSSRFRHNLRAYGEGAEEQPSAHIDLCADSGDSLGRLAQFDEESQQG